MLENLGIIKTKLCKMNFEFPQNFQLFKDWIAGNGPQVG